METRKSDKPPMPTIWEIPDEVWPMLQTILVLRWVSNA